MTDYLILGGGLAGCALASRLKENMPSASVTLLEAGPDEHENPLIVEPMGTFQLHESPMEYNYRTVPQSNYDGRVVYNSGGKLLSGSSSVNYAMWTRGGADDYNLLGEIVGDQRWSYEGMLPFFRKTETHHDLENTDRRQHGSNGPIHTTASARNYPLRNLLRSAFLEGTGLPTTSDANGGSPIGIAPYTENWRDGKRQPSGKAYSLKGVEVFTNAVVARLILDGSTAKGAELVDGRKFYAKDEVIISCGSIKTPQLLMLSGIGPSDELSRHGIPQLVNSPEVGRNFHDHCCVAQFYKVLMEKHYTATITLWLTQVYRQIKDPEKRYAAGAVNWNHPTYLLGIPADTVVTAPAPREALRAAMKSDGEQDLSDSNPHLRPTRGHIEVWT